MKEEQYLISFSERLSIYFLKYPGSCILLPGLDAMAWIGGSNRDITLQLLQIKLRAQFCRMISNLHQWPGASKNVLLSNLEMMLNWVTADLSKTEEFETGHEEKLFYHGDSQVMS